MRQIKDKNGKVINPIVYENRKNRTYPIADFNDNEREYLISNKSKYPKRKQRIINIILDSYEKCERPKKLANRYNVHPTYIPKIIKNWNRYGLKYIGSI